MAISIITNNVPRHITCGYELTEKERAEFDFLEGDDLDWGSFFRYRGDVHYLGNFMRIPEGADELSGWDGYSADSFFSGTLVRYADDGECIVVGYYVS